MQVLHAIWLADPGANHPARYTLVSAEDVQSDGFRANPAIADALGLDPA
jgi:hypothetical protein